MESMDYWLNEAKKNGGILPDTFSEHKELSEDEDLAYHIWINTNRPENLTKFSMGALKKILDFEPYDINSLAKSGLFDQKKLVELATQTPSALEFAPDEIVLDVLSKKPQYIPFISDDFVETQYETILPHLIEHPEILTNKRGIPLTLKTKPEVISLLKDILMDKISVPEKNLQTLLRNLPYQLKNDAELFLYLIEKNPSSYCYAEEQLHNDLDITNLAVSKDPQLVRYIGDELLQTNSDLNTLYFLQDPSQFASHKFAPRDTTNTALLEAVLKENLSNYQLLEGEALETSVAKNIEFGLQQLENVQKGAAQNPNLIYDLVSNREIMQLPPEVLKSFLEYDSKSIQAIIEISQQGQLESLKKFIDWTFENSGRNQRSAYGAIVNYQSVADLIPSIDMPNLSFNDKNALKHIIATKNPYEIKTAEELQQYPEKLKNDCLQQGSLEDIKEKLFQVLGYTTDDLKKLKESFPQLADHFPTIKFLDAAIASQNIISLKEMISQTDFNRILRAPSTLQQQFAHAYENEYRQALLNLSDIETTDVQSGVEIKDLGKKPFKIFMHRIFNFDESLSKNVKILMEHPEKWKTLTGATYISTSFITDTSIKGVFRPLKDERGDLLVMRDKETIETLERDIALSQKKENEIDANAVFLGFTEIPERSLISMAPTDMMTEHGGKHAEVKTQICKFYSPDDLAYSTTEPWNEVALTRENPQTGERIMPSCIICFDQHINQESLHFARSLHLPIVNINRTTYAEIKRQKQEHSKEEFKKTLSISSLRTLFYNTPMTEMVDCQAQEILNIIDTNQTASQDSKLKALGFLEEQFRRLISVEAVGQLRSYSQIKLDKLKGIYVSDEEKLGKILSGIKQSQQKFSPTSSLTNCLSEASQKKGQQAPSHQMLNALGSLGKQQ